VGNIAVRVAGQEGKAGLGQKACFEVEGCPRRHEALFSWRGLAGLRKPAATLIRIFRQSVVCIEPYDGLVDPYIIDLNYFTIWVQIQKLQVGYCDHAIVKNLMQKKVGQVVEIQTDVQGAGNFIRAKVKLMFVRCWKDLFL
jgi:hypothetical protein